MTRRALKPDGTPHPFISFGPESQYIDHALGVFRCYARMDAEESAVCRITGCSWDLHRPEYTAELLQKLKDDPMPHFVPPVVLKCRDCGVVAHPFKLWESQPYNIVEN